MNLVLAKPSSRLRHPPTGAVPFKNLFGHDDSIWKEWSISLPRGVPAGRLVHLASSRIGHQWSKHPEWLRAIRILVAQLVQQSDIALVTAPGTTCDPFVRWMCRRASLPTLSFTVHPTAPQRRSDSKTKIEMGDCPFWYPCQLMPHGSGPEQQRSESPDMGLMAISDRVYILAARRGGTVVRAAKDRLALGKATWLLQENRLTAPAIRDELLASGAVGWYPISNASSTPSNCRSVESTGSPLFGGRTAPIESLSDIDPSRYLIHWTRPGRTPWPDQTPLDWIEELIFRSNNQAAECCDALARILATQSLLGTSQLTRDPRPVVCFADVRLDELHCRRVFRPHLGRWDFTPFGLAIDRDWLREQGARPVIYGTDSEWARMTDADRPFFQWAPDAADSIRIDWRIESEWRRVGDLDLRTIPVDAARVFVPSRDAAESFAPLSRWPIVALNGPGSSRSVVDPTGVR